MASYICSLHTVAVVEFSEASYTAAENDRALLVPIIVTTPFEREIIMTVSQVPGTATGKYLE